MTRSEDDMLDAVWRLRRYRGKCVEYQGKPYMLLGAHYKKIGTEEVFGEEHDVVEGVCRDFSYGDQCA